MSEDGTREPAELPLERVHFEELVRELRRAWELLELPRRPRFRLLAGGGERAGTDGRGAQLRLVDPGPPGRSRRS
ncbi:MAG TPA: hypothetical protein VFA44_04830 [Gaiellaceae bacterium]|nr:hypothetical protein [Gaiellaceae bacterium]